MVSAGDICIAQVSYKKYQYEIQVYIYHTITPTDLPTSSILSWSQTRQEGLPSLIDYKKFCFSTIIGYAHN